MSRFLIRSVLWCAAVLLCFTGLIIADESPELTKTETGEQIEQPAETKTRAGEQINWQVISSGGIINGTSTNYQLSGTIGQTAVGYGTSASYGLSHGFWQEFGGGSCCDVAGDANNSGNVNIADVSFLINYIFGGGPTPDCPEEGDANGSGGINIADVSYLINYIFGGGPPPICGP